MGPFDFHNHREKHIMLRAIILAASILTITPAAGQNLPRPTSQQINQESEYDRRSRRIRICMDQVGRRLAEHHNAPVWAGRMDAARWCRENVR